MYRKQAQIIRLWLLLGVVMLGHAVSTIGEEVKHDFRTANFDWKLFRQEGPSPTLYIKPEPQGLHWRFVKGQAPTRPVGIYWQNQVRGDFVASARYEILDSVPSDDGGVVGVELYLILDTAARDGIALSRLTGSEKTAFSFQHLTNNEAGKRTSRAAKTVVTTPSTLRGRLRIAREGIAFIGSVAEGDSNSFTEIQRTDIGNMDVRMVRFAGLTGSDPEAQLDMRLLDFQVTATDLSRAGQFDSPPPTPIVAPPPKPLAASSAEKPNAPVTPATVAEPVPTDPSSRPNHRWLWSVVVLVAVAVGGAIVVWRHRQRHVTPVRSPPRQPAATAPASKPAAAPILTAAQTLSDESKMMLNCPACHQRLFVRDKLRGKRVKCPKCGNTTAVPAASEKVS